MKVFRTTVERLDLLEEYLCSDDLPKTAMRLSDLDGFLTGVACSPEPIPSAEWWPIIWGAEPPPNSQKQWKAAGLILEHHDHIVQSLSREPSFIQPVFWRDGDDHVSATDWCEGFTDAYVLRMDAWVDLIKTSGGQELLFPIFAHLFDDDGSSIMGISDDQVEEMLKHALDQITTVVPLIFAFWQSKRSTSN